MAWAIITIYTSLCVQMDFQHLPTVIGQNFIPDAKKYRENRRGWVSPPLVA